MADMVTKQELANAKIDAKDLGEAVNEKKTVTPRYGTPFKTVPLVIEELNTKANEVIAQGFYKGFATETLLLAAKPTVSEMRARADDTRKIWRWNRTSAEGVTPVTGTWTDTGLSDLDQARDFANANSLFKPPLINTAIDFNNYKTLGYYYFVSGTAWDNSLNKPPGISNQWTFMFVMPISATVVGQYVWCLNSLKMAFRFCNGAGVWSAWSVFSDDLSQTTVTKAAVNVDRDATFDARSISSTNPVFESLSKNFFDKNMPMLINYRITSAGALEYHLNSITTPLIYVAGITSIVVSGLTASAVAYRAFRFLDKDKKRISNAPILLNATKQTIAVPTNAVWFQLCLKDGIDTWTLDTSTIQLEEGSVDSAYTTYIKGKLKTLGGMDISVDSTQVQVALAPVFENLTRNFFDKSAPLLKNYRITGTGILEYHLNSVTTLPVYVKGQTSITVSGLTASAAAYRAYRFLDKDKNWISNAPILLNSTEKVIPVPKNAVWFQLCLKDGFDTWALNVDTIQFESGTAVTAYAEYSKGNLKSLYGADIASSSQSGQKASKAYGAKYLLFGDSITQSSRVDNGIFDETTSPFPNWPTYAKDQLQMSVFRNYAKSGAAFREYGQTNLWQMMSHQVNTAIANAETPDVIIVAMGTNDGVTANLGDYETAMGKATLTDLNRALTLEAARWAFWTIRSNFPNAVCFYANPLQRATADSTALAPLVDGLSKMALRYGFGLIDQHHESGIIRDLEVGDNHLYLADGLHPNTAGRILQANYIVSKIVARMMY